MVDLDKLKESAKAFRDWADWEIEMDTLKTKCQRVVEDENGEIRKCNNALRSRIAELEAERDRLRNAISKAIKTHWDIKLLSSDQCEAIDGLEAALRREGENGNSGR